MNDHEPVSITLIPEHWPPGTPPPAVRLKRLLKLALRSFGFKCTDLTTPRSDHHEPSTDQPLDPKV
jgi:hypothetical protein